jgi:hypothetical protein
MEYPFAWQVRRIQSVRIELKTKSVVATERHSLPTDTKLGNAICPTIAHNSGEIDHNAQ